MFGDCCGKRRCDSFTTQHWYNGGPSASLLSRVGALYSVTAPGWADRSTGSYLFHDLTTRALIRGPASVAGTVTGDARRVLFFVVVAMYALNRSAKTKQQSAFKRLPHLEKACIMPWDVLEKKRADHTLPKSGVDRTVCYTMVYANGITPVSYTHLTLPTICSV